MTNKKYTQEYKAEAVKLWLEGGQRSRELGEKLGVHRTHFLKWYRELNGHAVAPKRRPGAQAKGPAVWTEKDEMAAEMNRLRRENARLRTDYEILKKTVAIFSTEKQK